MGFPLLDKSTQVPNYSLVCIIDTSYQLACLALPCLAFLPACLPACLPARLPVCLPACLPVYLSACCRPSGQGISGMDQPAMTMSRNSKQRYRNTPWWRLANWQRPHCWRNLTSLIHWNCLIGYPNRTRYTPRTVSQTLMLMPAQYFFVQNLRLLFIQGQKSQTCEAPPFQPSIMAKMHK